MRKLLQTVAIALGFLILSPALTLAHNDSKDNGNKGSDIRGKIHFDWNFSRHQSGTVTAVSSTGFDLKNEGGTTYTVITANAKITKAFGGTIALADIHVNDKASVKGKTTNNQIEARTVVITPPNTHKAAAVGKVTAVNGNTVTVQTNHWGVPGTVTVKTSAETTYSQNKATTTSASLQVGAKIFVKGLWDEIQNALNAFRIKIK